MTTFASVARRRRESIFQLNPNRQEKANFIITDLFTNIDQVTKQAFSSEGKKSSLKVFLTSSHVLNPTILFALIILGLIISLFSFFMDFIVQKLQNLRLYFCSFDNEIYNLGFWIFFCVVFSELACFFSSVLNKDSQGSGIPEMKAILSGVKLRSFMSRKTLFGKVFGVVFATGGGLSIGKEGPLVHISGIIAHHLSKVSVFSHIHTVKYI